jgi:streptogramin lyase
MPRKPALFRQSDITKAIKGALKAGAKPDRVEVRPDGSFTIFNEEGALDRTSPDAEIARKVTS